MPTRALKGCRDSDPERVTDSVERPFCKKPSDFKEKALGSDSSAGNFRNRQLADSQGTFQEPKGF